jgi:hypothetical protein
MTTRLDGRAMRAVLALLLALGLVAAPTASVLACSCAGPNTPVQAAAFAAENDGLGFIGTVVGAQDAPVTPNVIGQEVIYAFAVKRSTEPVPETIEVRALNDPGGAACGFAFGVDEEWFVTAFSEAGTLRTGLCSGNQRVADIDAESMAGLVEALSNVPGPGDAGATSGGIEIPTPILALGALLVLVGAVSFVAFRRAGPSA